MHCSLSFRQLLRDFGIPILEAWGNGCPIALSKTNCFTEIAGDAAVYFDATKKDSITEVVKQTLEKHTLRRELIKKGNERIKLFTWEKAAQKLEQVYKTVLDGK